MGWGWGGEICSVNRIQTYRYIARYLNKSINNLQPREWERWKGNERKRVRERRRVRKRERQREREREREREIDRQIDRERE